MFTEGQRVQITYGYGWDGPGTVDKVHTYGAIRVHHDDGRTGTFNPENLSPADPTGLKRVKVSDLQPGDKFTEGDIEVKFIRHEVTVRYTYASGRAQALHRDPNSDVFLVVPVESVRVTVPRAVAEAYVADNDRTVRQPIDAAFKEALKK